MTPRPPQIQHTGGWAAIACVIALGWPAGAWEPQRVDGPERRPVVAKEVELPPQIHKNGALCGDPGLVGVPIKKITGRLRGCDVPEPVQIMAVAGVGLSRPVNLDCPTARALRLWVERDVKPAFEVLGGGLVRLEVAGSYACRTQNRIPGAPLSHHGRGRAIDISGFTLKNGQRLSVLTGWNSKGLSGVFRTIHSAACGPFGTVLGPKADVYHRDHFHLDTHRRRSGDICR